MYIVGVSLSTVSRILTARMTTVNGTFPFVSSLYTSSSVSYTLRPISLLLLLLLHGTGMSAVSRSFFPNMWCTACRRYYSAVMRRSAASSTGNSTRQKPFVDTSRSGSVPVTPSAQIIGYQTSSSAIAERPRCGGGVSFGKNISAKIVHLISL